MYFPRSVHDTRIWKESPISTVLEEIYRQNPNETFYLLGDSGYPLRPWLQTPLRDPEPDSPEERYNRK
ncbi:hypothetical protein NQ315_011276 [Exocentrus adspersus]|uniref:DDE Tnp4 domain-containing protein n=1 Tax=Exocentrus adspersus TaxID=1586481 RepID=A0AAV8VKF0_9CUCU|nr:hypothetical protein NQ315_011276 [Exocentrus adspersus]